MIDIRIRCDSHHFSHILLPVLESKFSKFLQDRARPSLPSRLQGFDTERQVILPRKSFNLDTVKCRGHTHQSPHPCHPSERRCLERSAFSLVAAFSQSGVPLDEHPDMRNACTKALRIYAAKAQAVVGAGGMWDIKTLEWCWSNAITQVRMCRAVLSQVFFGTEYTIFEGMLFFGSTCGLSCIQFSSFVNSTAVVNGRQKFVDF